MDPNIPTQPTYSPQIATPQVYTPPVGQPVQPRGNKKKIFIGLGIILTLLIAGTLVGLKIFKDRNVYQKPKAWVISQSLNSSLAKQRSLLSSDYTSASASSNIRPEVVKVGKDYLLSTGVLGEVSLDLPKNVYKVSLVSVPGVDFTGVPSKIAPSEGTYELNIGVTQGSGKIKGQEIKISNPPEGTTKLKVTLYHDKNGDGLKGADELSLPWAGVTIKLTESKLWN